MKWYTRLYWWVGTIIVTGMIAYETVSLYAWHINSRNVSDSALKSN